MRRKLRVIWFELTYLTIVIDPSLNFASEFYKAIQSNLISWAAGEGSFVVVALLEALSGGERDEMITYLKRDRKTIENQGKENKGTKIVLENIV